MRPDLPGWESLAAFLIVQTAVISAAAAMVNYKIRRPKARRAVWQAALLGLACVWLGEAAGAGEKARAFWPHETGSVIEAFQAPLTITQGASLGDSTAPARPVAAEIPAAPVKWPGELWLLGTMLLLLRACFNRGWLAWQRRRMELAEVETQGTVERLSTTLGLKAVEVRKWPRLRGPVAFGWRHPTVALPADFCRRFTPGQQEAMLAHELAHLAARDPAWLTLADVVCALAWWNPAIWWSAARLRAASETAADEASALVPAGPSALAESLLRFGRELVESTPARGLGVAGNGFRSSLGRRVKALLTSSGEWRELPARWRWLPRVFAVILVAALTLLPVVPGPSGSVAEFFALSAWAELTTSPTTSDPTQPIEGGGLAVSSGISGTDNNGTAASANRPTIQIEVKIASVRDGSPPQVAVDKILGQLPMDKTGGAEDVAAFLKEAKMVHTQNIRVNYQFTTNEFATLTGAQFKAALDTLEKQKGCVILSAPKTIQFPGQQARVESANVQTLVTGVEAVSGGRTNIYSTDQLYTGVMTQLLPVPAGDGWDITVLSRLTSFLGYDDPGNRDKGPAVAPLPRIGVSEIRGRALVHPDETLLLRGPLVTQTNKVVDSVLGIFHRTRVNTVRNRLYVFVTPKAGPETAR